MFKAEVSVGGGGGGLDALFPIAETVLSCLCFGKVYLGEDGIDDVLGLGGSGWRWRW